MTTEHGANLPPQDATPLTGGSAGSDPVPTETVDGVLGRFPEAVAAGALPAGSASHFGTSALGFRIMLFSALAVGSVTGLSLVAAWILQAVLAGSYIHGGGDYFSSGIEANMARDLLSIPLGGFVVVLLLCLVGMCVGAWGIQRGKAR